MCPRQNQQPTLPKPAVNAVPRERSKLTPDKQLAARQALLALLKDFSDLLLRAGISAPEMGELFRLAFVDAAANATRLRNDRFNQAAIAAMTGLTRVEVKKLLDQKAVLPITAQPPRHWASRLVEGWRNDPDFTDRQGHPLALVAGRGNPSFAELVRRYSGDMTPRAARQELSRLGLIKINGPDITLNAENGVSTQLGIVHKLALTLQPVLSSLGEATTGSGAIDSLNGEIDLPHPLSRKLLARHLKIALPQFIESAQIAANGMKAGPKDRKLPPTEKTKISIICVNFEPKKK